MKPSHKRRLLAAWAWLLLAALPSAAAVRDVPAVDAAVGAAPVSPAAAAGAVPSLAPLTPSGPSLSAAPVPSLAPALAAPAALPASPIAAAADGALRYNPAVPAEAEVGPLSTDKPDGLRQLKNSLEARGDLHSIGLAEKLYYTDPMTGLPNRAYFVERGAQVLAGKPEPTIAILDMNNFGVVNIGLADEHGVTKGRARADGVLAVAGAALGELAERHDVKVIRLGGEEFVLLGSRSDVLAFSAEARRMMPADKVLEAAGIRQGSAERRAIEAAQARVGRAGQPVGDFTYGVASAQGRDPAEALKAADAALNAAKEEGGRGSIRIANADGSSSEWTPPAAAAAAPSLPAAPARDVVSEVAALEARLQPKERQLFHEAAFKDPLTLTRSYDYVALRAAEWDRLYARGGAVVISSARNLKQINDLLGHEAGDRYLRRLGVILRQAINKARNRRKLDVQEPVRVASKEFLLVGRDAETVSKLAALAVKEAFDGGRMLTADEVARLRKEAVSRGLTPEARAQLIGTLRVVSERIDDGHGRADSRAALDRAFERLEEQKRVEDKDASPAPPRFSPN